MENNFLIAKKDHSLEIWTQETFWKVTKRTILKKLLFDLSTTWQNILRRDLVDLYLKTRAVSIRL